MANFGTEAFRTAPEQLRPKLRKTNWRQRLFPVRAAGAPQLAEDHDTSHARQADAAAMLGEEAVAAIRKPEPMTMPMEMSLNLRGAFDRVAEVLAHRGEL